MMPVEYIARAIIRKDGKVLLCRNKKLANWFFPGGHIEPGEQAPLALLREIKEEIGLDATVLGFLGAVENKYHRDEESIQEINLVFEVVLDEHKETQSAEDHLEFAWFTNEEMKDLLVFPASLRDVVVAGDIAKPLWLSEGFEY